MAVHDHDVRVATVVSSVLSVVGALCMVIMFANAKRMRQFPARIAFNLSVVDFVWFLTTALNILMGSTSCGWWGPIQQFCSTAAIAWHCIIAHNLYRLCTSPPAKPHVTERAYHIVVWSLATLTLVLPFFGTSRVMSGTWLYGVTRVGSCYISEDHMYWRLALQAGPAILAFIHNAVTYSISLRRVTQQYPELPHVRNGVRNRALRYLAVFAISWTPAVALDIYLAASGRTGDSISTGLLLVQGILFFSQGLMNAIVYIWNKWNTVFAKKFSFACCLKHKGDELDETTSLMDDASDKASSIGFADGDIMGGELSLGEPRDDHPVHVQNLERTLTEDLYHIRVGSTGGGPHGPLHEYTRSGTSTYSYGTHHGIAGTGSPA